MIETKYDLYQGDEFKIEKLVIGKPGQYIHMVFPKGKGLPIHKSNAELFMTVLRGTLSLKLDNQELENIQSGTMIKIPINTLMNVTNQNEKTCELIVVKILPEWFSRYKWKPPILTITKKVDCVKLFNMSTFTVSLELYQAFFDAI